MAELQTIDTTNDATVAMTMVLAKALKRKTQRPVEKPSKAKANKTQAKTPARSPVTTTCRKWVANYIYADGDGKAAIAIKVISAANKDDALAIAEAQAPGNEFVLNLLPQ